MTKLLARPGQPAAERAGRTTESPGGFVEGEALEVAEHHRQTERSRQAVDLAMDGRGLLAIDCRPVGRRSGRLGLSARAGTRTIHGGALLPLAPAGDLLLRAPRRPDRHTVQPVA